MQLKYAFLLAITVLFFSCSKSDDFQNDFELNVPETENALEFEQKLFDAVNQYRDSIGKSKLKFDAVAYSYANKHSNYMISKDTINHDFFSFRSSGIKSKTRAKNVSENVARNFQTSNGVIRGWINSPTHKETLEGNFTHTAISIKIDREGKFYFTQIFFR